MAMPVAYFHNEILRRSDPINFPFPAAYDGLEYAIKENMANVANPPPYVPEPSSVNFALLVNIKEKIQGRISSQYENDRVRFAVNELYGLFACVAIECRKTLAQIRARLIYQNLPQAEKERIEGDVRDFFARRYTSFVAIVIASDATTAAADSRSFRIPLNEEIISQASSHQLLILPDSHIVSTATGSDQLWILPNHPSEGFDFIDPLLKAKGLSPDNEGDRQDWAKGQLSVSNQERWGVLRYHGISGA